MVNEEIKAGDIVQLKTTSAEYIVEAINKHGNLKLTSFSDEKGPKTLSNIKPIMVKKVGNHG